MSLPRCHGVSAEGEKAGARLTPAGGSLQMPMGIILSATSAGRAHVHDVSLIVDGFDRHFHKGGSSC